MPKGPRSPDRQAGSVAGREPSRPDELTIAAAGAEVQRAMEWLEAACRRRDVPQAPAERLALCLHEALVNVITHGGGAAAAAPIELALKVGPVPEGIKASVTISDAGAAFNPLSLPPKALPATLDEAAPGGLGLVMIRRCADWLDYRHEDGRNRLTFGARWSGAAAGQGTTRFRRGPDRRRASVPVVLDRRSRDRRSDAIHWIPLFRHAGPRELSEAIAECEVLLLSAGGTLLRAGEANHNVFILLSGKLVAHMEADPANALEFDILPGECIGELSAIDGKPISAEVLAVAASRVLRMDREVFWNRVMRLTGVAENLMTTLAERMRRANWKALAIQREQLELKHLRKELEVARQLQASMLPLQRPLFPGRTDIEVCGFMEPASKVGGDLFDAFFVDDRTLFVCIGDVSGHGIAAALFMVRAIGLVRALAMETTQPDRLLETLNDRLCIGNEANLFLTLFCGFLDVPGGRFVYANGGHCAPIVSNARDAGFLPLPRGILVGAASGRHYSSMQRELAIGETLFCYTDGLSEAESRAGVPFSEQGCLEALRRGAQDPLSDLLDALHEKVVNHTGSSVMADDCTMLAVRRLAPER